MGTIVYESLLKLLLDEKDHTLDEIINIAVNEYGLDKSETRFHIGIIINISGNVIEKLPNGKYHKKEEFCRNLNIMLGGPERRPPGYFDSRPKLRKLYENLEKKYGKSQTADRV
nr:hypothetical protein [Nanoarchaeota archaeon]